MLLCIKENKCKDNLFFYITNTSFRIDKLTGALYLGDLVRRILAQFVLDGELFGGTHVEKLDFSDTFPTKYISEILRYKDMLSSFFYKFLI
jgi:hexokinase